MAKTIVVRSGATVYPGRDNPSKVAFYDESTLDTTLVAAITRMTVAIGGVTVDSSLYRSLFDWTTDAATAEVTFRLGVLALPCPATGATVTVFSATYPLGLEYPNVGLNVALPTLPAPVDGSLDSLTLRYTSDGTLYTITVAKDDAGNAYLSIS